MSFEPMVENPGKQILRQIFRAVGQAGVVMLVAILVICTAVGQQANLQTASSQDDFAARLTVGDDEQRLGAATQLALLFAGLPNSGTPKTLGALKSSLQSDSSSVVRALSARALENCCGEQVVPGLLASLASEREVGVRKVIIYALARYRSPQIVSSLTPLLKDKNNEIRSASVYALAEIGDAASAIVLVEVLQTRRKEEDAFVRSQAARGLGRIGNRSGIDALLNALTRDKSQEVRRESARALGLLAYKQDAKVAEGLRQATLQDDPYLVAIAIEALNKINLRNP